MSIRKFFIAFITPLAFFNLLFIQVASSDSHINFEYLNADKNYQREATFPFDTNNEIVVASKSVDVRTLLPIEVSVGVVGAKKYTNTIPNDPIKYCRGADGCSIPGPKLAKPSSGSQVVITAKDKNGQLLVEDKFTVDGQAVTQTPSQTQTPAQQQTKEAPAAKTPAVSKDQSNDGFIIPAWLIIVLLILLTGGVGLFFLANKQPGDECEEGSCQQCELVDLLATAHNFPVGSEEALREAAISLFKALGWVKFTAAPTAKAFTGPLAGPIVESALRTALDTLFAEKKAFGLDLYAVIEWETCKRSAQFLWFGGTTSWVKERKLVQIMPKDYEKMTRTPKSDTGWNPDYAYPKSAAARKELRERIEKEAKAQCPAACKPDKKSSSKKI